MTTIWLIASGTFGDAIRRRTINVFLAVAVLLILAAFLTTSCVPGREMTVIKSLGLGIIGLVGVFISVILGISLIPDEIERRTIYTVLSKPVQRYQFLCGKFLGGLLTVLSNIALMALAFLLLTLIKERFHVNQDVRDVFQGIILLFFQITLVGAVALFFSVFVSPFVNFFLTFAIYLLGSTDIASSLAADPDHKKNPLAVLFFKFLHVVVPNFSNFNIANPLTRPDVQITSAASYILYNVAYALVYTGILLLGAIFIFDRKEV